MSISIVGAGPAGCTAGIYLVRNGFDVKIYEKNLKKEKPCGGGLSWRVLKEFGEFLENIPQYPIKDVLFDYENYKFELNFSKKVGVIINRFIFDKKLRSVARENGVKIINKKVDLNKIKDDFIIDARGYCKCKNPGIAIRCICKKKNQKMFFLFREKIVKFGYFWIFPISSSLVNAGVGGVIKNFKIKPMVALNWFLKEMNLKTSNISAAALCMDDKIDFLTENNIIKVGERAGLINPITGEGIYHAMKSGKIAAECIVENKVHEYERIINKEFNKEFKFSKRISSLMSKLPVSISKHVFKFGIDNIKQKIERDAI